MVLNPNSSYYHPFQRSVCGSNKWNKKNQVLTVILIEVQLIQLTVSTKSSCGCRSEPWYYNCNVHCQHTQIVHLCPSLCVPSPRTSQESAHIIACTQAAFTRPKVLFMGIDSREA